MSNVRNKLRDAKRIVIKVGTSTLTYSTGKTNLTLIDKLARVISDLVNQEKEVILVSSGAIGIGMSKLKLKERPKLIKDRQAVAAVGQCELMHIYSKSFSEYGHVVGQILLTSTVVSDNVGRKNAINTFNTLLEKEIIPIVNANDSVSVEELRAGQHDIFSENDTLAAVVSKLVKADAMIILSDVNGFYSCDPKENPDAKLISTIYEITPDIEHCAGGAGTKRGTGGMVTRLKAAKIATAAGVDMIVANGSDPCIVREILDGKDVGTIFIGIKRESSIDENLIDEDSIDEEETV